MPAALPLYCEPELPLPSIPLAPLFFLFKVVALESTAFSNSAGADSGGGGALTVGFCVTDGAFILMHIIISLLVGRPRTITPYD